MKKEEFNIQKRIIAKKVKNKLNLKKTSDNDVEDEIAEAEKEFAKDIHDSFKLSLIYELKDAMSELEKASKGEEYREKKIWDFFWACKILMEEIEKNGFVDWIPND